MVFSIFIFFFYLFLSCQRLSLSGDPTFFHCTNSAGRGGRDENGSLCCFKLKGVSLSWLPSCRLKEIGTDRFIESLMPNTIATASFSLSLESTQG
uniref:Secreted protein n=1 Tax=Rhizophora mucronata TaxID=61149 RepID=A0A2P2JKB2_RHIMU